MCSRRIRLRDPDEPVCPRRFHQRALEGLLVAGGEQQAVHTVAQVQSCNILCPRGLLDRLDGFDEPGILRQNLSSDALAGGWLIATRS
jgi:hypothetical protein